MTRTQRLILVGLGAVTLIVLVGAVLLLVWRPTRKTPAPTLAVATVPPSMALLTRTPLCQDVLRQALAEQGWPGSASLDAQSATLEIRLDAAPQEGEVPAGPIWAAFEATLAGRAAGCTGYGTIVVWVGEYRAEVALDDLLAWQAGELDDGAFSDRVSLIR